MKGLHIDNIATGPSKSIRQYLIDPFDVDSAYSVELSDEYKRTKIDELVDTGTVSTRGWELSSRSKWGPTWRDQRTAFAYDGTYYRVRIESQAAVERERWVFYLDWDDQNPGEDATIISLSDNSLSKQDRMILEAAQGMIPYRDRRDFDPDRPNRFTVVFHEELDADSSNLVPDPPFDYLEHDGEYFRAVSERGSVEKTEQTFTVEPVAESYTEYRQYAEDTYPDVRFSNVDLSEGAAEVLDEATRVNLTPPDESVYKEKPPLSSELEEVLEHLTIAEYLEPHDAIDDSMHFYNAVAEYGGQWYEFDLSVYP
ncbi:hypothetical protein CHINAEXTREME_09145 [Halobiforma lacisalsi AJ5]|uniref:Uncharacterized protein n=1 Tax=Natronobacterium lacisalsi AJ5 TaxID=358396 RepID=M0L977_NATLA|nr:hypothetical protein [Halobiforma lacisalsi]APW97933.1 hypothetical protein CHINAEXTREME_09145 [Halobiforma lacisalsi AJ5]EMA28485.1 hypothetical protein C445_17711 [Halobiforma lacisalsi AJ5]